MFELCSEGVSMRVESTTSDSDIGPVLTFLRTRTPAGWVDAAVADLDTLLQDHASLELKAAQQAQKLIRRYAAGSGRGSTRLDGAFRSALANRMSRLAREELRHFEQVVALIERRGDQYAAVSPSRYAARLHDLASSQEPGALVDSLIIGAVIEARSCERFFSLIENPGRIDQPVASFYRSLLRAEARHFENYLTLARAAPGFPIAERLDSFLARDAELIESPDVELRFLSGVPVTG
jgi:tRNA-(ms[2]io[6]A)-hydroxylase